MLRIESLKNHPDLLPQVVQLWYDHHAHFWNPHPSLEEAESHFQNEQHFFPITFIALEGKTLVGICALREHDSVRIDLQPWLGSLVVDPAFRRRGIGKELVDAVKKQAQELGFKKMYLFTIKPELPRYYETLGWKKIGEEQFQHQRAVLMELSFITPSNY